MQVGSRIDALPESYEYRDTGCDLAPSCLRCPLPQCKYDAVVERSAADRDRETAERRAAIMRMHAEGVDEAEIAARVGLTPLTVHRLVRGWKP